ncbi:MAG: hypothetical protein ACI4XA_10470 [Oscillospiraceae bacterium]
MMTVKTAYSTGQRKTPARADSPKKAAERRQETHEPVFAGNSAELELLRQELRCRSDRLRNTAVRETEAKKLPEKKESAKEYTARIENDRETMYLGADKEKKTLLAAANPRGREASHGEEDCGYISDSSRCSVSSAVPKQRDEFTLENSRLSDDGFIYTAAEDEKLERDGEGQIRRAAEPFSSEKDELTADEIKETKGLSEEEDTELSGLSDLAQSVRQRSSALVLSAEKQTRKIINHISEQKPSGDDFFDFLRRRGDEDEVQPESGSDNGTEGIAHEEDH